MAEKKIFNFYYDLCCQKLIVYSGTKSEEIKSTIRELLEIPEDKKVIYLDEEGNPLVISSALPNNINIYVQIKKSFTEQYFEQNQDSSKNQENTIEWFWTGEKGEMTYELKNNNKTVTHISNRRSSFCKGNLIMNSGEYYYTIFFEPLQCCVFATICSSDYESEYSNKFREIDWLDFWRLWPDYEDPHAKFPGPIIHAGFYINMSKKLMIIFDDKTRKEIKRVNFNEKWHSICPIIQFKHKVSISIGTNAIKGRPSFVKNV